MLLEDEQIEVQRRNLEVITVSVDAQQSQGFNSKKGIPILGK